MQRKVFSMAARTFINVFAVGVVASFSVFSLKLLGSTAGKTVDVVADDINHIKGLPQVSRKTA